MTELEMRTIFGLVIDPDNNKVNVQDKKMKAEIQRMVRILEISNQQRDIFIELGVSDLTTFELVYSEN